MSKAIEKAAVYQPSELFLLSLLAGAGGFGGARLLTDIHNNLTNVTPSDNSIKLQIPNPHKRQEDNGMASTDPTMGTQLPALNKGAQDLSPASITNPPTLGNTFAPYLAVAGGIPAGFLGAKLLYDKYQQSEQEKQIASVKNQYAKQLMMAQQATAKLAEETPNVDKLCEAMAIELEKSAGNFAEISKSLGKSLGLGVSGLGAYEGLSHASPTGILGNSAKPIISGISPSEIINKAPKDIDSVAQYADDAQAYGRTSFNKDLNTVGLGLPVAAEDAWKDMAGLSGVGLLGLLIHNHTKKKEREMKASYPTNISYAN